jgi:MFS family permease
VTAKYTGPSLTARISSAGWVLGLLFAINLVNYLDRLLAVAAGPTLKLEFGLSDRDIGLLASAFLLIYTVAALPLGLVADRVARSRVVALGVALWSVTSGATAFCRSFGGLLATRAGVGIGEASYFPAGAALLSAYYPLKQRARAMSRWGAGQMVGTALAFALIAALDRALGPLLGWRAAFAIAAAPGLLLAALMWFVRDRPAANGEPAAESSAVAAPGTAPAETVRLSSPSQTLAGVLAQIGGVLRIRTVVLSIALQAIVYIVTTPTITFLTIYVPSRASGFRLGPGQAALISGLVIVLGGLAGTLFGGYLADWLSPRVPGGRILAIGLGFAAALPCYVVALLTHALPVFLVAATLAVVALTIQVGPLGAIVQDATPAHLRASAVAVSLVLAHLLGDAWAATAVGAISTALGERTNLGLLIVGVPALVVGMAVALLGARVYLADLAARQGSRP